MHTVTLHLFHVRDMKDLIAQLEEKGMGGLNIWRRFGKVVVSVQVPEECYEEAVKVARYDLLKLGLETEEVE